MERYRVGLAMVCVLLLASLSGCMASTVGTSHEYVLARTKGNELVALEDDDPLYEQFDSEVFDDPYLHRLLMVFEHTTESFLATNTQTALRQTIANRLLIVVDSAQVRVLRNVTVHYNQRRVPIELAIGLGRNGRVDLARAQQDLSRVMAPLLLELVGLRADRTHPSASCQVHEVTSPQEALWVGFEAALESIYGQQHRGLIAELRAQEPQTPEALDRLRRYELVPHNGLRFVFEGGRPTSEIRSSQEASCTPGVVATFLYRLLEQAGSFYPQRYMLWFVSFEADEIPYGKLLLAASRMPRHIDVSIQTFIGSYADTYPAESASVLALAKEVFGDDESVR